jgi:putative modified peptide
MAGPKTAPLEPKIVDRLLDLLGDSDKFRELFQSDPAAALELVGHQEPIAAAKVLTASATGSGSITGCISVNQLASKETIQTARTELRSMLLSGLSQTAPQLDASSSVE